MDSEKTPLLNTDSTSHTYVDFDKNLRHSSYKGETNTNLEYVFFYIIIMAKRTTYIDKLEN
jgi:hypothetical protein